MTGHSPIAVPAMGAGLTVSLVLSAVLIPPFGIMGGAIARAADLVVWNLYLAIGTYRTIGINVTALVIPRWARST
jgi:O-antigen/teichoic acid export membrane protein